MQDKMKKYVNKETLLYMFWGVITSLLNIGIYYALVNNGFNVAISNTVANFIGISAAYFTNKYFVFSTKTENFKEQKKEIKIFFISRILTFILETVMLVILVESLGFNKNICKIFTSAVIVILNYFVSKKHIFVSK